MISRKSLSFILKSELVGKGLLKTSMESVAGATNLQPNLSFEQQKELLLLQMEHEKLKQRSEESKQELEKAKLEVEVLKLNLMREGKLSGSRESFSLSSNLKLVPKINEEDPNTFFTLFERMASLRDWSGDNCVSLLRCVLTGKAQVAFSSMSIDDCKDYDEVKSVILKVYECVPEDYRQRFHLQEKEQAQTHLEFARD